MTKESTSPISARTVVVDMESISPYAPSRYITAKKNSGETSEEYEERIFRDRVHYMPDGHACIPGVQFARNVTGAAFLQSEKIPGKGQKTWGAVFKSGLLVVDAVVLPETKDDIKGEWLLLHAQPSKPTGSRVMKLMPYIPTWKGSLRFYVMSPMIDAQTFEKYCHTAGMLCGIGRFAPRAGGHYGRWKPTAFHWET